MRRTLLLATTLLFADTRQEVMDVFASMAAALSEGNPSAFVRAVDPSMPGYASLARNVNALATQNEVTSAIEIAKQEGDDRAQTVELDWLLEIRGKDQSHVFVRRQAIVKCRAERLKGRWRVVSLEPVDFFAPPGV
jgi:murein L,D-transpeptidase YcbB/YkuD